MRLHPQSFAMAALLTALVAVAPLSTDMYLPALPTIAVYFGASPSQVQLTLSAFLIGFAVAQLIVGPMSDRYGRRPVMIGGVCIFVLTSFVCMIADSIEMLTIARFFQAVGACAGGAVGRAVVRDIHNPRDGARLLAHMGSAMAIGPLVAPLIGGQLTAAFGWHANFVALAIMGLAVLTISVFTLPETHTNRDLQALSPRRMAANYKTLLRDRQFQLFTLTNAFSFGGLFAFISGSSFVLIESLGMSPQTFGIAFAISVTGYISGTQVAARKLKTESFEHLIGIGGRIGLIAGIAGPLTVWLAPPSVATVVAPMFFYAFSVGFVMPNSMAGAMAPFPHMAGAASALMGFIQMALSAIFGAWVGWMYDGTAMPMMATIAFCGTMAWIFATKVEKSARLISNDINPQK